METKSSFHLGGKFKKKETNKKPNYYPLLQKRETHPKSPVRELHQRFLFLEAGLGLTMYLGRELHLLNFMARFFQGKLKFILAFLV